MSLSEPETETEQAYSYRPGASIGNYHARNIPSFVYVPGSSPLFFTHASRHVHLNDITNVIIHRLSHLLLQTITTQSIILHARQCLLDSHS